MTEGNGTKVNSTKDLKRVLGRKELLAIGIGQTIGSGIFAMVGVGIAMTGRSASISMLLAAIFTIFTNIPLIFVAGTVRLRGGFYTQLALLGNDVMAGFFVIVHILSWTALAMYALSFADYLLGLIPALAGMEWMRQGIALLVLTIFFITNVFGIEGAAKLQNAMMVIMVLALTAFIAFGLPHVTPHYFEQPEFMTNGVKSMLSAGALFTWAVGGANVVIHLGAECKNPTKDIPFVIVVATCIIAVFYAGLVVVASGVLPVAEVANQPLTLVSAEVLPYPIHVFFIVGGAMFALSTTLNSALGWVTKPILQAAVDGWFPPKVGTISKKHKTPIVILSMFYIECVIVILFDIPISTIGNMAVILNNVFFALLAFTSYNMIKRIPKVWEKSRFHIKNGWLLFWAVVGGVSLICQTTLLFSDLKPWEFAANVIVLILGLLYAVLRKKSGKVNMEVSYEEA